MRRPPASTQSTSQPAYQKQAPTGYLQCAEQLIKDNQPTAAHRLLLSHARAHFRNPNLWLMLARTAPNPSAAQEYYRVCAMLKPTNTLTKAGLGTTRIYAQDASQLPQNLVARESFMHTTSYPASPTHQSWLLRLLQMLKGE